MKTANYNIRLDPAIKTKAEETFAAFGLNLSEAINVFLHMSIKQQGFPFEIREPKLNAETLSAMQETNRYLLNTPTVPVCLSLLPIRMKCLRQWIRRIKQRERMYKYIPDYSAILA